jgi:predicted homoserine dehydrogenase-like protein
MIAADLAEREQAGRPIRVGIIGAGKFGSSVAHQVSRMPGLRLVALADLFPDKAQAVFARNGLMADDVLRAGDAQSIARAIEQGKAAVTDDPLALCDAPLDVVVEATGVPENGARIGAAAIARGKHIVMVNMETDVAVGSLLNKRARAAGVVYTVADGDQPGCIMRLVDWAQALGLEVVVAGRGTRRFRTDREGDPDEAFARYGYDPQLVREQQLNAQMYNSFRDGSKSQIEMCSVANMTGLVPDVRGMHEPSATIPDLATVFSLQAEGGVLNAFGVVELANAVAPDGETVLPNHLDIGVFIVVRTDHARIAQDLGFYGLKMGPDGTTAAHYRPYHLCGIEAPMSIAEAGLYGKPTGAPIGTPVADVIAVAKRDLTAGETLDGSGGRMVYGLIERAEVVRAENLLPLTMTNGVRLTRAVAVDQPITYDMIERPADSFLWSLRAEQDAIFAGADMAR